MFNFKLQTKITLTMIMVMSTVIIINGAIFGYDFTKKYKKALQKEAAIHASFVAKDIMKLLDEGGSLNKYESLNEACKEIVDKNSNIGYIAVTDKNGIILYHSDIDKAKEKRSSEWIRRVRQEANNQDAILQEVQFNQDFFYDVTVAVTSDNGVINGYVSAGLKEKVIGDALLSAISLAFVTAIISLLVIILMSSIFGRSIITPLNKLIEIMKNITRGEADLRKRLNIASQDEIGELAGLFDRFMDNTQGMIIKFKATSNNIVNASRKISGDSAAVNTVVDKQHESTEITLTSIEEMNANFSEIAMNIENLTATTEEASSSILQIAASIEEVTKIAEDVSISVDEASSSIEEMAISIREVAANSEELSASADSTVASIGQITASIREVEHATKDSKSVAEETASDAEKGMLAVEKTIEAMNNIKISVEDAAKVIKKLGEKSADIGEILDVIDEIAEQTNLLALNAAIIAAQAGEHGKSFAVVADEIKDLSERTASSTKEIASLIKAVQIESGNAVASMELGSKRVGEGVVLSEEAGTSLEKILQGALRSKDMVIHIAKAAAEQLKGSQQVKEAMENVNHLIMRIAMATQEQSKGSELIIKVTETMKDATSHVKRATQEQSRGGRQITEAIENITNMTSFVNRTTQEQSKGVSVVISNIEKIRKLSKEYGKAAESMNVAVGVLIEQSEILESEASKFKV